MSVFVPNYSSFRISSTKAMYNFKHYRTLDSKRISEKNDTLIKKVMYYISVNIESYSAIMEDRSPVDEFDFFLVGEDYVLLGLASYILSKKGYKVLVQPFLNFYDEYTGRDILYEEKNKMESPVLCRVISRYLGIKECDNFVDIIKHCFNESEFNHGVKDSIPIINTSYKFNVTNDGINNYLINDVGYSIEKSISNEKTELLLSLKRMRLMGCNKNERKFNQYHNIFKCNNIILVSDFPFDKEFDAVNLSRIGDAEKPIKSYDMYGIDDRLKEIIKVIDHIGKL